MYFNLQQQGQNVNMISPCILLLLSCEVKPLWGGQVCYAIETETGVLCSMPKKTICKLLDKNQHFTTIWYTNKNISKIYLSQLNNDGLRHNKTIESIMLIFTQFQPTSCLRYPQFES